MLVAADKNAFYQAKVGAYRLEATIWQSLAYREHLRRQRLFIPKSLYNSLQFELGMLQVTVSRCKYGWATKDSALGDDANPRFLKVSDPGTTGLWHQIESQLGTPDSGDTEGTAFPMNYEI